MTAMVGGNFTTAVTETGEGKGFGLGDRLVRSNGKEYVWVQADGAITGEGYVCIIDENYQAAMLSTSNDEAQAQVGVAPYAFADNDYGWLQVYGPCNIRVAASAAAQAKLNSTATAGQVDDDDTAGAFSVQGMRLTTSNGGSAGTAAGIVVYPVLYTVAEA